MDLEDGAYWKSLINMSLTRFLVLDTLHDEPCHGYAIVDKLRQSTQDCCTPTYGGIYPVLKQLVQGGYATARTEVEKGRKRRVYELTEKGERAYQVAIGAWQDATPVVLKIIGEFDI